MDVFIPIGDYEKSVSIPDACKALVDRSTKKGPYPRSQVGFQILRAEHEQTFAICPLDGRARLSQVGLIHARYLMTEQPASDKTQGGQKSPLLPVVLQASGYSANGLHWRRSFTCRLTAVPP
jgi:hypothetical protein